MLVGHVHVVELVDIHVVHVEVAALHEVVDVVVVFTCYLAAHLALTAQVVN